MFFFYLGTVHSLFSNIFLQEKCLHHPVVKS